MKDKIIILYKNKWCRIISKGTIYLLQGYPIGKYNDQYFQTSDDAFKKIGINFDEISDEDLQAAADKFDDIRNNPDKYFAKP